MNKLIKTLIILASVAMSTSSAYSAATVDTYKFKMRLSVPRIYDNTQSLGYRKYQKQTIEGLLHIYYWDDGSSEFRITELVNKTHKVNGSRITYECYPHPLINDSLVVGIGHNKTMVFKQSGMYFAFVADPSYNIGGVEEDNSLYVELSGHGKLAKKTKYGCRIPNNIAGSAVGKLGCGCTAYGHKSPTRLYTGFLSDIVYDIAPVDGTWVARWRSRTYSNETKPEEEYYDDEYGSCQDDE